MNPLQRGTRTAEQGTVAAAIILVACWLTGSEPPLAVVLALEVILTALAGVTQRVMECRGWLSPRHGAVTD